MDTSPPASPATNRALLSPARSPVHRNEAQEQSPTPSPRAEEQSLIPIPSPRVEVVLGDGKRVMLSKRAIESATIATAAAPGNKFSRVCLFDSGFGGLDMVVTLAEKGIASIVHIKGSHALFPKEALEDALRGAPGGSHLEMQAIINGHNYIAVGYKYNSKKTLFFLAPEGAGGTVDGEPYVTKWPDEHGNVMTRNVLRNLLVSRYFILFNKVDKHNQLRQHELGLEKKWLIDDGWFRLFCTLIGITVIDTMLTLRAECHSEHPFKTMTTLEFAETLSEELVTNTIDGCLSQPRKRQGSKPPPASPSESQGATVHVLRSLGNISTVRRLKPNEKDVPRQLRCTLCQKKCTTFCSALVCKQATVCKARRDCYEKHLAAFGVSLESVSGVECFTPPSVKRPRV